MAVVFRPMAGTASTHNIPSLRYQCCLPSWGYWKIVFLSFGFLWFYFSVFCCGRLLKIVFLVSETRFYSTIFCLFISTVVIANKVHIHFVIGVYILTYDVKKLLHSFTKINGTDFNLLPSLQSFKHVTIVLVFLGVSQKKNSFTADCVDFQIDVCRIMGGSSLLMALLLMCDGMHWAAG